MRYLIQNLYGPKMFSELLDQGSSVTEMPNFHHVLIMYLLKNPLRTSLQIWLITIDDTDKTKSCSGFHL
ncbi:L-arabinose isomerase [Dirofilaria immitis]